MRISKMVAALAAVGVVLATCAAGALAEEILWKWLPGEVGEPFEGKTGKVKIQVKAGVVFECGEGLILLSESSLIEQNGDATFGLDAELALAQLHLTKCKGVGLAASSLADPSEVILIHFHIHNCMIAPGHYGWLMEPLPVHIEVPAAKLLVLLEGDFVALVEPLEVVEKRTKHFDLIAKQKAGVQAIEKCKGGEVETLLVEENESAVKRQTGIEFSAALILFDFVAQEPMEN